MSTLKSKIKPWNDSTRIPINLPDHYKLKINEYIRKNPNIVLSQSDVVRQALVFYLLIKDS